MHILLNNNKRSKINMPKKLKLNLDELKVQSFVTGLDDDMLKKMKGGTGDDEDSRSLPYTCSCCYITNTPPATGCGPTTNPCYTNCTPPGTAC
jgi:hypothetical protein